MQGMSFVAQGRDLRPFPRELQSPSPWGRCCSSSLPPPTETAQSLPETKAPPAEGKWGDESAQSACMSIITFF